MPDSIIKEIYDFLDVKGFIGGSTNPRSGGNVDGDTFFDKSKRAYKQERSNNIILKRKLNDANDKIERLVKKVRELEDEIKRLTGRW